MTTEETKRLDYTLEHPDRWFIHVRHRDFEGFEEISGKALELVGYEAIDLVVHRNGQGYSVSCGVTGATIGAFGSRPEVAIKRAQKRMDETFKGHLCCIRVMRRICIILYGRSPRYRFVDWETEGER